MNILGLGNVTEVNSAYIFVNEEGKQDRLNSTKELLTEVLSTAKENIRFYERMMEEVKAEYEKKKAYVEKHYHYITDEDLERIKETGDKQAYFMAHISQESNNRYCSREYSQVFGFFEGFNYAMERKYEAIKIQAQAEEALKRL